MVSVPAPLTGGYLLAGAFLLCGVAALLLVSRAGAAEPRSPGARFLEIWRFETTRGDFAEAARGYEGLYEPAPTQRVSMADRERAAFRAGRCLEAVGNLPRAAIAYRWLVRHGRPDGLLARRAAARLRVLASADAEGAEPSYESALARATAGAPPGVDEVLRAMLARASRRPRRARELATAVDGLLLRLRGVRTLLDDLRDEGLALTFSRQPRFSEASLERLVGDFVARFGEMSEWRVVVDRAGDHLYQQGLEACIEGDFCSGRRWLEVVVWLDESHEGATEFLAILGDVTTPATLVRLATGRRADHRRLLTTRYRRELRLLLEDALSLQRDHRILPKLEAARALLHAAPRFVRIDPEIRQQRERLWHAYVVAGGPAAEPLLERLWTDSARQTEQYLRLAVAWIELRVESRVYREQPEATAAIAPEEVARKWLKKLSVAVARSRRSAGADADADRRLKEIQVEYLRDHWFPDLAPSA